MRVLFVCLGNICRSPLAEGAFRRHVEAAGLADKFEIDSAGTGDWHVGDPPDPRSIRVAQKHGVDLTTLRGRQIRPADLQRFDEIFAMDRANLRDIKRLAGGSSRARISLLLEETANPNGSKAGEALDVPDPYYGGPDGFEHVWTLVDEACGALLERLRQTIAH